MAIPHGCSVRNYICDILGQGSNTDLPLSSDPRSQPQERAHVGGGRARKVLWEEPEGPFSGALITAALRGSISVDMQAGERWGKLAQARRPSSWIWAADGERCGVAWKAGGEEWPRNWCLRNSQMGELYPRQRQIFGARALDNSGPEDPAYQSLPPVWPPGMPVTTLGGCIHQFPGCHPDARWPRCFAQALPRCQHSLISMATRGSNHTPLRPALDSQAGAYDLEPADLCGLSRGNQTAMA